MRRGAGEGHASAFLGKSPCFRQLRLPLCGDGQNEGKSFRKEAPQLTPPSSRAGLRLGSGLGPSGI